MNIDIEDIKKIAQKAGDKILEYYKKDFNVSFKDENSPVTDADLASNDIIVKSLEKYKYPILSEEMKDDKSRLKSRFVWIIDPLDGTSDFVGKTDDFCVIIALVEIDQPILGVIYEPVAKRFYFAKKNFGAFKEVDDKVKKMSVNGDLNYDSMRIFLSRNHLGKKEQVITKELNLKVIISGSAGLKLAKISDGEGDIYINSSDRSSEWDTCAGKLILEESGGRFTDICGDSIKYNQTDNLHRKGYMATSGHKHEKIIEVLKKYDKN